jgi:RNA polymerase sigma factor (sigma-70 family)
MPAGQLQGVIHHLRRATLLRDGAGLGDAELLELFVSRRDEAAFEALVRRHGPMVLGVCRRVLKNDADAEDAFQAVFLVLVRKAASILPRARVGNWLYGVAHKTALKAKAMSRTRRAKEQHAAASPTRDAMEDGWASLLEVLDGELSTLPEKYRTPIILCDLEGLSYREAAARLGCPQGTLSGRLTRARSLLARRVARRGMTLTAGTLATLLARHAGASVSPSLIASTTRTATVLAAGQGLTAGAVSTTVASLTEGVLKMLLLSKLKIVTGMLLFMTAVVAAGWMCAAQVSAYSSIPGDNTLPLAADDETRAPAPKKGAASDSVDSREAEFVFLAGERGRKTVSLVVAGTSAPVLKLPVNDDVRALAGGRRVGIDGLRSGARVFIRLDPTNSAIQEIRALEAPQKVIILTTAKDLDSLKTPSEGEVLRALGPVVRGIPMIYEEIRDDIQIVAERLVDTIDPPRFFPLVGQAQLHRCHWKCTVYYTETVESQYPYPFRSKRPRVEEVYLDKDFLVPVK